LDIYRDSGNGAETLASIDMMWEKHQQGENSIFIQDLDFDNYAGAVVYASRTPLEEVNLDISRSEYDFNVLRRGTGGSPVVLRPNDLAVTISKSGSEDLLENYIGPALIDSLERVGAKGEFEIKSGENRRALWVDGKPISSFSSREKDSSYLSGVVFVDQFDVERISNMINLRPGEEEYIDQMPAVSDYSNDAEDLGEVLLEVLEGERKSLANWMTRLEEKAETYSGEISDKSGSSHRGFCPVYRDDLKQFRYRLEDSQ